MAAKKDSSIAAPVVSDKKKALETAMQQIEKTYGKGSIMRYGDNVQPNVEAIPTGSLALDLALGIGGVPRGRIIEIYGPESSGKTTLALHVLAQAQKMGGEVAFVDAEHALDPTYARALGCFHVIVHTVYLACGKRCGSATHWYRTAPQLPQIRNLMRLPSRPFRLKVTSASLCQPTRISLPPQY